MFKPILQKPSSCTKEIHQILVESTSDNPKGVFVLQLGEIIDNGLYHMVQSIDFLDIKDFDQEAEFWASDTKNLRLEIERSIKTFRGNTWINIAYVEKGLIIAWDTISRYQSGNFIASIMKLSL